VDNRQLPAYHTGPTCLNKWRETQIDLSDMRADAHNQNKTGAQKSNDHGLQMGLPVSEDTQAYQRIAGSSAPIVGSRP
jgi:hypothetical protein